MNISFSEKQIVKWRVGNTQEFYINTRIPETSNVKSLLKTPKLPQLLII